MWSPNCGSAPFPPPFRDGNEEETSEVGVFTLESTWRWRSSPAASEAYNAMAWDSSGGQKNEIKLNFKSGSKHSQRPTQPPAVTKKTNRVLFGWTSGDAFQKVKFSTFIEILTWPRVGTFHHRVIIQNIWGSDPNGKGVELPGCSRLTCRPNCQERLPLLRAQDFTYSSGRILALEMSEHFEIFWRTAISAPKVAPKSHLHQGLQVNFVHLLSTWILWMRKS